MWTAPTLMSEVAAERLIWFGQLIWLDESNRNESLCRRRQYRVSRSGSHGSESLPCPLPCLPQLASRLTLIRRRYAIILKAHRWSTDCDLLFCILR